MAAAGAMLVFFLLSYKFARGRATAAWTVFISGSAILLGFYVLPYFYFGAGVVANPGRLLPEFDLACIFVFAAIVSRMLRHAKFRRVAWVLLIVAFLPAARYLKHPWGPFPPAGPLHEQYEYRITKWVHENLPGQRVFATGTLRYWFDGWFDNAQTDGLSLQGMQNQVLPHAMWQVTAGERANLASLWLQALGTDAIIVPDKNSPEHYHDFQHPEKFRGILQPLYDDHAGTVIYRVPRASPGIGRLIASDSLSGIGSIRAGDDIERLSQFVAVVENAARRPAEVQWRGPDAFDISADVAAGESILIQETYDPAWHVYAGGRPLRVRRDPVMGFMIIDAPPGAQGLQARFETPLENRIGGGVSVASLLVVFAFVGSSATLRRRRAASIQKRIPRLPPYLNAIRVLLRRLNYHFSRIQRDGAGEPFDAQRLKQCEEALRTIRMPDAAGAAYLEKHVPRLARTLALAPPSRKAGRALELGCYMQITPFLKRLCGYTEVRGAYYGTPGRIDRKTVHFPDGDFSCDVSHFNAERDPFPYPDEYFELVVAAEIIEHLTCDPMHMLLEARRVLSEGGYLLLSTPNIGSITSVAKTLGGQDNPQIFFLYDRPVEGCQTDMGHVREYTVHELGNAVRAAGFEVEQLFTTFIDEFSTHRPLLEFLAASGYNAENRGEQSWCLAVKRSSLPVDRYPYFIYTP